MLTKHRCADIQESANRPEYKLPDAYSSKTMRSLDSSTSSNPLVLESAEGDHE